MKMRSLFIAAASAAALMAAGASANAATIDLSGVSNLNEQGVASAEQVGAAIDVNFGQVSASNVAADVTNALEVNTLTASVDQRANPGDTFGAFAAASLVQNVNYQVANQVEQAGLAVVGTGGVNNSTLAATVTNAALVNSTDITVKQ